MASDWNLLDSEAAITSWLVKLLSQTVKTMQELHLTQVLFSIILSFIIIKIIVLRNQRNRMLETSATIPYSAPALPIIGHGHYFFGDPESTFRNALMLSAAPCPSKILLGPKLIVLVNSPENLEICFNSPHSQNKTSIYDAMRMALGDSILLSAGRKWRKNRKVISPIMKQRYLNNMVKVFVDKSNTLLKVIEEQNGETFDIFMKLGPCSFEIVCETILGFQTNVQRGDCKLFDALVRGMDLVAERIFKFYLHPIILYKMTSQYRTLKKDIDFCHNYTKNAIEARIKWREEKLRDPVKAEADESLGYKILVDLLIENEDKLTPEEIHDEINTFFLTATDTTVSGLGFIFLMIAMHKDVQQRIYDELVDRLGLTKAVEYTDLTNLPYTDLVIKETLRLFPLVPIVSREAEEEIKLGEHTIPKGADIAITVITTHRNEAYYKDPLKFIPERFLPEEVAKRHPYAYYPFTLGSRKCIGQKFSLMMMKTLLSIVIRKFRLETDYKTVEDIRLKDSVVMKAHDGFKLRAFSRI